MSKERPTFEQLLDSLDVDTDASVETTRRLETRTARCQTQVAQTVTTSQPRGAANPIETLEAQTSSVEIVNEVATGGLSTIHRAVQHPFCRDVAVKTVRAEKANSNSTTTLLEEGVLTGWLDHPNIVPVYALLEESDVPAIMMKYIDGRPWDALIDQPEDLGDFFQADSLIESHIEILLEVCKAVSFAHKRGIIHCDIKPQNVMVGDFGEVFVIDWGLAAVVDDTHLPEDWSPGESEETVPVGTPGFMAPEMVSGDPSRLTRRTDVYLLGATLHAAVVGHAPHTGDTLEEILEAAHRSRRHNYGADLPRELVDILRTAMARDPADRYGSVRQLRQALQNFRRHQQSRRMTDEGIERSLTLRESMGGNDSPAADAEFYQHLGRAQFALEEALDLWDNNTRAEAALQSLLVDVIEWELERQDLRTAPMFIEELPEARPDLRERLRRARERREDQRDREAFFHSAPNAIAVVDAEGTLTHVNEALLDLFGWTRPRLEGQPVEVLLPERYRNRHTAHRNGFIDDPSRRPMGTTLDLQALRRDGTEFPVDISLSPVETGGERFVVASIQPLNDAGTPREDASTMPRKILRALPDPILVERGGRFVFANPAGLELFGATTSSDVVGRPIDTLITPVERFHEACDRLDQDNDATYTVDLSLESGSGAGADVVATISRLEFGPSTRHGCLVRFARRQAAEASTGSE